MKKSLECTNLVGWLGPDTKRLWATSFTVDEHEAFALAFRALGGRIVPDGVYLNFQRSGFRRAGQGVVPREWLHPIDVPVESPLATYHPKLLLAETHAGHSLIISTGNLARDDFRNTRNLATHFEVARPVADKLVNWIRQRPLGHRALCLHVHKNKVRFRKPQTNASCLSQFMHLVERCPACRSNRARTGHWVVAAPFWSPRVLEIMLKHEPKGKVEAYFRTQSVWDKVAAHTQVALGEHELERVTAFALRDSRESLPSWHHKVVGWRCCARRGARSALYLGSANATVSGFFGLRNNSAVNWEAGVIWLGGEALWDAARSVARAGYAATTLRRPQCDLQEGVRDDDELGAADTEEMERIFAAYAAHCIKLNRNTRTIRRIHSNCEVVRALGYDWKLIKLRLRFEHRTEVREGKLLHIGRPLTVPLGVRAQVRALFECQSDDDMRAETTIDLVELDPEPERPAPDRRSAIASALAGLWSSDWGELTGSGEKQMRGESASLRDDVRFPFAELFALRTRRPAAADGWLQRITSNKEEALKPLPDFWRLIAREVCDKI